jgi:hypothetical protein
VTMHRLATFVATTALALSMAGCSQSAAPGPATTPAARSEQISSARAQASTPGAAAMSEFWGGRSVAKRSSVCARFRTHPTSAWLYFKNSTWRSVARSSLHSLGTHA